MQRERVGGNILESQASGFSHTRRINANAVLGPETHTSTADTGVPFIEIIEVDAVCLGDFSAGLPSLDKMVFLAYVRPQRLACGIRVKDSSSRHIQFAAVPSCVLTVPVVLGGAALLLTPVGATAEG